MRYPLTFYVDDLGPDFCGKTYGPVILIRKDCKDDKGLYQHELVHVKQWWMTLGIHSILYKFIRKYRFWAELKAYKKQLKYSPNKTAVFAHYIWSMYNLGMDYYEILAALRKN